MKKLYLYFIISVHTIAVGIMSDKLYAAENIDPDSENSRFAYSENAGWLNFEPEGNRGYGAEVTGSTVTGYVWGGNVGWLSLSCENTFSCGVSNYGIVNDGSGNLSGYVWGENIGWCNFNPTGGGVIIDFNGDFNGQAWCENIGWVHFNNQAVPYKVSTAFHGTGAPPIPTPIPSPTPSPTLDPTPTPIPTDTPPIVELVSFTGGDAGRGVLLKWEIAAEIDNAGFSIWRAVSGDRKNYTLIIGNLIPAEVGETWGAEYSHMDRNILPGMTYHYKLEMVKQNGDSTFHGPVSVTVRKIIRRIRKRR